MNIERREMERDEEGNPKSDGEERTVTAPEQLNSMKALWLRDKDEASEEEYNEFYKHISHDWTNPLARIQAKIEGTLEYRLLLYVPENAPFEMMMPVEARNKGLHLYIKRVFIMDDCRELLPDYLRFIRGVVDSEDLPLNISRELLQENRQVQRMSKGIVSKILATLKDLKEKEADKYLKFWRAFGPVLKEGVFQDAENREALLDLILFDTTGTEEAPASLAACIDRMKPDQEAIYYLTGESRGRLLASPHLEAFRAKDYEVLLLTDPVDEVWTQYVSEYKGKALLPAGKGAVELGTDTEKEAAAKEREEKEKTYGDLLVSLRSLLDERVKEVRLSGRLTSSPACLVLDDHDVSPQLERMLRAMGQEMPPVKRILELNPNHPLLERLNELRSREGADELLKPYAELLYTQALIAEGGQAPDPASFTKHMADVMLKALGQEIA